MRVLARLTGVSLNRSTPATRAAGGDAVPRGKRGHAYGRNTSTKGHAMQWLWSPKAIKTHILFGMLSAIFISLCLGSEQEFQKFMPGNSWIWMLLFLVIGYPFLLFLLWSEYRNAHPQFPRAVDPEIEEPGEPQTLENGGELR
jgi:hypothetical protein